MNQHPVTTVEIRAQVQWNFFKDESSGRWIAICDPLKLTIEGDTHTELRENIADGLNLLLLDLVRENELNDFLTKRGWSVVGQAPTSGHEIQFDVPFELIAKRNNDFTRAIH